MPKIFISYSRVDRNFVDDFAPLLREVYGKNEVWVDDELRGGQVWWEEILRQIAHCDVFIYLLSNDSIESDYCQAEYQEALRINKLILPVQIRSRTKIPPELSKLQFVDLSFGVKDGRGMTRLYASISQLVNNTPVQSSAPLAPDPIPVPDITLSIRRSSPRTFSAILLVSSIVLLLMVIIFALISIWQNPPITSMTPTTQTTSNSTSTPEPFSAETLTLSTANIPNLPEATTINIVDVVTTLDAQGTAEAQTTLIAVSTQAISDATASATLWTNTPAPTISFTPNITASINAFITERAATFTVQYVLDLTLTSSAANWTATHYAVLTQTAAVPTIVLAPNIVQLDNKLVISTLGTILLISMFISILASMGMIRAHLFRKRFSKLNEVTLRVFISYRRSVSSVLADKVYSDLKYKYNTDVILDDRLRKDRGAIPFHVLKEIARCDVFICIVGDITFESEWVKKEIEQAYVLGKLMIPVFHEGYVLPAEVSEDYIKALLNSQGVEMLDKRGKFLDESIGEIVSIMRNHKK